MLTFIEVIFLSLCLIPLGDFTVPFLFMTYKSVSPLQIIPISSNPERLNAYGSFPLKCPTGTYNKARSKLNSPTNLPVPVLSINERHHHTLSSRGRKPEITVSSHFCPTLPHHRYIQWACPVNSHYQISLETYKYSHGDPSNVYSELSNSLATSLKTNCIDVSSSQSHRTLQSTLLNACTWPCLCPLTKPLG